MTSAFEKELQSHGLDPVKVLRDLNRALGLMLLMMTQMDTRVGMTAAFMALSCAATQRVPAELGDEFTVIFKNVLEQFKPLILSDAEIKASNDEALLKLLPTGTAIN